MCACKLDLSPSGSTPALCELEDLLTLVSMASYQGDSPSEGDLYAQLAQKEQDLILAAELGKALLDKNLELSTRNEQLLEEYSSKIEELEQERHELHLRLEKIEAEYENTVKELQYDIGYLRHELQSSKQQEQTGDRERSQTIRSLKQQNERLNEQLKQSAYREEELGEEVQTLREQMMSKRTSMHEHVIHLEILREEKNQIQEKCHEVEKRIGMLTEERDALACSLEESHDRIMMLERQKQEKDQQLHQQQREVMELQEANAQLQAQVEHLSQQSQSSSTGPSMNLFSELTAMSPGFENSLHSEMREDHPLNPWHRSMSAEMLDEDDYECDDDDDQFEMAMLANSTISNESSFLTEFQEATATSSSREEETELRTEVIGTYKQLQKMLRVIKGESTCSNDSSDEDAGAHGGQAGKLGDCLHDLQQLMQDMMSMHMDQSDYSYGGATASASASMVSSLSMDCMEKSISDLHVELMTAQRDLNKVQQECATRDAQLMQKSAEFAAMAQKLQEQQDRLVQLQRERDQLQDSMMGDISKDNILQQTRKDRDLAMEKGHQLEVELAKSKMDLMTLNQQLVGAIKQKVTLSQELDQWQIMWTTSTSTDMEHLLHYQKKETVEQSQNEKEAEAEEDDDELEEEHMKKSTSASSFFAGKKS
ncbi:BICD family-like cargo adapter 1 isoform X4 [Haliotis rufescens]|uniref:BICD family-like cargo adapter 1 isoform X4 n=1 Tax=Haliotis rufescens TaxID=6454 RepID=UPI001EAFFBF3|nr:BICD family-like cargo adapter 1 isoform X4 [Haliotis rufescens]